MSKVLRDCVEEWPPRNGAAVEDSPVADDSDIIKHARVSSDRYLILDLEQAGQRFTASTKIRESFADQLTHVVSGLPGNTIAQAGAVTVDPHD